MPLKLTYPEAHIPTVQLSLDASLDPRVHMAIGRALASLRDEGVFIIGSGMSFHNMRGFGKADGQERFGNIWRLAGRYHALATRSSATMHLAAWSDAPVARLAHPREEHLIPLMVASGAAYADVATVAYQGSMMGVKISAYHFI